MDTPTLPMNTSGLSKSQKKRMRQKAAKAKKEAEKKMNGGQANGLPNGGSLSPHEKLCSDLIRKGYSLTEIEQALEEMWNLGMQYDDFNAALAYLEGKRAKEEAMAQEKIAAQAATDRIENVSAPASASISADSLEKESSVGTGPVEELDANASANASAAAPSSISASESRPQSLDLASKLDVAAKFENLYDAVFALSEWVTKAAKPNQLLSLCTTGQTTQCPALYTIFHRVLNTASDSEFESVLPVLLSLTSGIYVTKGKQMAPTVSSCLSDTLYNVRDTMRLSISIQSSEIDTTSMSNTMVDTVADQICESFKLVISDESSSSNLEDYKGDKINMIRQLENEIESLFAQQPVSNDGGVLELMTRRDCRKTAAEKSSIVAKLILPSQKESREQNGGMLHSDMNGGAEITFSNLFGDQFHAFQRSRSAYLNLESRLKSLNATWVQERDQVSTEIETCQTDLTRIESRKQELQKELDSLNNEENRLTKREELLKQRLEAVYNSSSTPEVDDMKAEMKERAGLIDVEEKVKGISEKLSNMNLIFSSKKNKERGVQNGNHVDINSVEVQSKLESFLILVKNYFIAEADCVNFMQTRVAKIQHDAKDLQREIAECTVLGMQTSVSKLSGSLESMSRDIAEDEGVISLLRGDAERIRDDVVKRVTEYTATGNPITAVHENVLGTIGVIMLRIGIASNDRLFHSNRSDTYISAKPPTYQPQQVSSKSNGHAPNSSESALAVESNDAPLKLKWASGSASKSQVKSLVDIQKEELSRKAN